MGIKIGFLTTLGVNVGDEFIREGIRHVLDQCGVPYAPFYVNKREHWFAGFSCGCFVHQPVTDSFVSPVIAG